MVNPGVALFPRPNSRRVARRPQHTFYVTPRPYQIQPVLMAPVLPGETMQNLLLQARVVTDPIVNKLIGWWCEFYVFYVKFSDLDEADEATAMLLDPSYNVVSAGLTETSSDGAYHFYASANRPGINWTKLALKRVVECYFRNEGEAWNDYLIGSLPIASIKSNSWLDSAHLDDTLAAEDVTADLNADGTLKASEIEESLRRYSILRMQGLTEMDYNDWVASFGVGGIAAEAERRPELVRYVSEWSYPTNTIDPTNGTARSAVSWSIAERGDKQRFFREPGFLLGCMVARPKVYLENIRGAGVMMMKSARSWLPAVLSEDPTAGFVKLAHVAGDTAAEYPLGVVTDTGGAWADVRDLLVHGDQFLGITMGTDTGYSEVAFPNADLSNKRYINNTTEVDSLFSAASPANKIRADGVFSLNILGRTSDRTPSVTSTV